MENNRILLTGAGGQIGQVLTKTLEERYGKENILATDLKPVDVFHQFEILDVLDEVGYREMVKKFRPDVIFHLVGVLRSEERRVGKECRVDWSRSNYTEL